MVDITRRLQEIKRLVDEGEYFSVNRARQYGKTTTLAMLKQYLETEYTVFFISFEGLGEEVFADSDSFSRNLLGLLSDTIDYGETKNVPDSVTQFLQQKMNDFSSSMTFRELSNVISKFCALCEKPVVLMIDEVDQAGNYKTFVEWLGVLRDKYLKRTNRQTFQSVILAGVYDIKNLKLKIRGNNGHQYNSPWNIAAKFTVDMDFSVEDITGMLECYEQDCQTGMNVNEIAQLIYDYTGGYPYLVSDLCKIMDEQLSESQCCAEIWTKQGVLEAVRVLLSESNTLFDDMRKKLQDYGELLKMFKDILFSGLDFPYNNYNTVIDIAKMFGYVRNNHGTVQVANRIFETWLYNWMISEEKLNNRIYDVGSQDRTQFVKNGVLNVEQILRRFVVHFTEMYGSNDAAFLEKVGRKYFLFYLKPIINGTGNYYVEAETRDSKRTDVIIDYLGQQYIIELKIWHGEEYNARGEQQLLEYLDCYHLDKGYMLSFNFNKKKEIGVKEIPVRNKILIEAVV
jgi:hypothetical protein